MTATRKPGQRPSDLRPPAHLSPSPPLPEPSEGEPSDVAEDELSPTRYGDWERKGIAIDF